MSKLPYPDPGHGLALDRGRVAALADRAEDGVDGWLLAADEVRAVAGVVAVLGVDGVELRDQRLALCMAAAAGIG